MSKHKKRQIGTQVDTVSSLVDIVIPVYNRFDILQDCIFALSNIVEPKFTLTLVDNASDRKEADNFYTSLNTMQFFGKYARVIRNKTNTGFSAACNDGAKLNQSPYILFLNSDVILEQNSIHHMLDTMQTKERAGIVGAKLLFPDDVDEKGLNPNIRPKGRVQHVGLSIDINGRIYHPFVGWEEDNYRVNRMGELNQFAVTGACLMIKTQLFRQIGKFGIEYEMGTYEDIDLCMKVRDLGYNIYVNPQAVGKHYTGASAEAYRVQFPLNKNEALFRSKWMNKIEWWDYKIL